MLVGGAHMAVGQTQWYHFGVSAPPILVYFSGDWDVHRGYGLWTHGHMLEDIRFWDQNPKRDAWMFLVAQVESLGKQAAKYWGSDLEPRGRRVVASRS